MERPAQVETEQSVLQLPEGLPVPVDDGAADHLPGKAMPLARLRSTQGSSFALIDLPMGRSLIFVYPRTGRPARKLPQGWSDIPGARGCSTELISVRDDFDALRTAGARAVYGLSTHDSAHQIEAARRLNLPYPLLADPTCEVGRVLKLPTFEVDGVTYYKRLTLVVQDCVIEKVFYPIFPPNTHAAEVLTWLRGRRR